ncbi:hypothetical protein [Thermobrachium celere]|uniref:hypothetical protein n=1 Tax=Thermobrachium celere TaxID=53422 RepID=UPI0019421846|nr:hypothetical protein [Thermobrachium celere]GFR34350.1 hypothetical protein TCEA9_01620 [Thermobrachium celere]
MMDFLGFEAQDFDFFKNLDRLSNGDYTKQREASKNSFRAFCYELQKVYHKETGGFLELEKEFLKSNRKLDYFKATHKVNEEINIDFVLSQAGISIFYESNDVGILTRCKNKIWEYILSNKKSFISLNRLTKNKYSEVIRLGCMDLNMKAYESIINLIQDENYKYKIFIGVFFSKAECLKLKKQLINSSYDEFKKLNDFIKTL